MIGPCPVITLLVKPGATSCTVDCQDCTCLARVLGTPHAWHAGTKEQRNG